ncbi:MAG TPA: TldD/PmbA family protein [Actinomycetota bacterium]|nr:TldD/PmbA family protein [Actinomycetota bacterium]
MPDLGDLVRAAVEAAESGEAVEAYSEESRQTEASALRGEVEGLQFAESRGVGVRLIRDGQLGYAYAADPSLDEVRAAVGRARENASLTEPDGFNVLPDAETAAAIPELFRKDSADVPTADKVQMALDLERRLVSTDPRVAKVDVAQVGDAVSRVAIASTSGVDAEYARTDAWVVAVTLAVEDDETQTGFSYRIARALDELGVEAVADEAIERSVRMLGASKPQTAKVPIVLDQFAAEEFLGVLASALNAENVLKGRSLFAEMVGQQVGSELFTLVDDGTILDGPGAAPFDGEGVPTGRTELFTAGTLNGFLHDTYTAARMGNGQRSTGNATRGSYKGSPGVGTSNFYLDNGSTPFDELLRQADGGVLIAEVTGVHSGANPISGEFSVGATGLRIEGGALGEPLREMTIASTLPEMLAGITGLGDDLRFFSSVGTPSVLIGEMTLAGV